MPTKSKQAASQVKDAPLSSAWESAWNALSPIRSTWDEKEQALMAQTNDSVSGNIVATRVSDAALSTLAYERQARVTAQLPTGRVYAMTKKDQANAAALNITLNNYILPNADDQFDMLIKLRLWGVYASVYGSMPMMYDYRVDERYVGPTCYLIDPRCFAPVEGTHNVQQAGCYISTIMTVTELEEILERSTTSYNKTKVRLLIKYIKDEKARPSKDGDSSKTGSTVGQRYDLSNAKDRCEVVTKYTHGRWVTIAPDFADLKAGEDLIIRDMANPHKSGRIPVVMRHCFPLLNSVFGLGDFERGMKIQKAKDSIINLFLEGAKNRVYPPLKMIDSLLTPSTIRYQAGTKWKVKQQNAVEAMQFGQAPLAEFQATFAALQSMLQNQFGTSTAEVTHEQGDANGGRTPQALKMAASRENARDTWDRFMGEIATQELFEGMLNLLTVKMEKPVNFSVFEDDIKALGYMAAAFDDNGKKQDPKNVQGLEVFDEAGKVGKVTLNKADVNSKNKVGYRYLIDSNSTMKQDEEEQFSALMATWQLTHQDPMLEQRLAMKGLEYDEADHLKKIFIAAGISDWEKVLKEISPEKMQQLKAAAQQAGPAAQAGLGAPGGDPAGALTAALAQAQAAGGQPMPAGAPAGPMPQAPMQPVQPQQMPAPAGPPMGPVMQQPMPPQAGGVLAPQMPQFEDPQIAALANQMLAGVAR